ncbi:MAG TPA: ABC transporter substrate-binding protein [Candidatus Acidoferrales bacterium]|nr:ABC transporter substrate-binding protein [Candidatus Acidoferrales bacterium]
MTIPHITRRQWLMQAVAGAVTLAGCSRKPSESGGNSNAGGDNFKIGLIFFAPEEGADTCMKGLYDGLKDRGFERGRNLEILSAHAQGEISNIPLLIQNYDSQGLNAIITMTTPCLAAACNLAKKTPVVFTYCYDPIAAGAGKSMTDHLPNITGVGSFPPVDDTVDLIQKLIPNVKAVGTVYNTSEANSVKVISVARESFKKRGIKLEEVTATGTSEVFQAAQVVCYRGVQALWVTGDNTALQGFDGIVKASRDAKLPLIINDPEFTMRGAVASVGLGWYEAGHAGGVLAARVLRGESPRDIPFEEVAVKKIVLNDDAAHRLGLVFPPEIVKAAKG